MSAQYLRAYEDVSGSGFVLATDDYSVTPRVLVAARALETIFIERIQVNVSTDNAATQTFEDTAGTPLIAARTKVSPGIGPIELMEAGDEAVGLALTEGQGFQLVNSAAGLAYSFSFKAYRRRTAGGAP